LALEQRRLVFVRNQKTPRPNKRDNEIVAMINRMLALMEAHDYCRIMRINRNGRGTVVAVTRPVGTGFGPMAWVAYGPHWPRLPPPASPAPMLRSRASPGSDARHWSPDVILGFAEYALSFPIYIRLSFSLFALSTITFGQ
jgi:hypothetical protein